jgi:hypothetical protein
MFRSSTIRRLLSSLCVAGAASLSAIAFTGCERKETVLDVDTPGADVSVERNIDTGEVEVETTDN